MKAIYIFGSLTLLFFLMIVHKKINAQTLNYYFGNLHAHSAYSDGNKDASVSGCNNPACSFAYAKASQHFDFLGISEHNHSTAGLNISNYKAGYTQAQSANQEGTFLCLYGMEWGVTTNSSDGHVVIYGFGNQLIGWEAGNYDIYVAKSDFDALFKKVKNNPNAFCYLAHPGSNNFNYLANNPYNATYDSAIVAVPYKSGPAFSTVSNYTDYAGGDYLDYYKKLLSKGYKIGCAYDHDTHYTNFGRSNAGRLVILAPALTTANLFQAMKNMNFYGSDDWNAKVDFKVNGSFIMGSIVTSSLNPTITVVHNDADGELADSVLVWSGYAGSNSYPVIVSKAKSTNVLSYIDTNIALNSQKYYFIEIRQQDGQRIVTSPIWYSKDLYASVSSLQNNPSIITYPNPVMDKMYISSVQKNYQIKIYDVLHRPVYSQVSDGENIVLNIGFLSAGIYFLEIEQNRQIIYHQKFIKE